jgi:hypothetical protein
LQDGTARGKLASALKDKSGPNLTANDFRKMALGLPETLESAHMGHADFRVKGKIFATLPYEDRGMVKLTPEQQRQYVEAEPDIFAPVQGGWGRRGATYVHLAAVTAAASDVLLGALRAAWLNVAPKRLAKECDME